MISFSSVMRARPTRSPSRSASRSGSGSPVMPTRRSPSYPCSGSSASPGVCVSASSGPSSIIARRTCWSHVAHVDVAGAGVVGGARERTRERRVLDVRRDEERLACTTFAPTRTASSAYRSRRVIYDSCHTSSRRIGTAVPSLVIPSTATSGPPIMKSVWTPETLMPRSRSSSGSRPSRPSIPKVTPEP